MGTFLSQIFVSNLNIPLSPFLPSQGFLFCDESETDFEFYKNRSFENFRELIPKTHRNIYFIIPVYNELHRLEEKSSQFPYGENFVRIKIRQLETLFIQNPNYDWNLFFVDDGDTKFKTGRKIEKLLVNEYSSYLEHKKIEVLYLQDLNPRIASKSKKGGAITSAFRYIVETRKDDNALLIFSDADISSNLLLAGDLIYSLEKGYDVVITSRWHPGSTVKKRGIIAKFSSWIYNRLVMMILDLRFSDTQNGFKGFSIDIVKEILPLTKEIGFAFDTEYLVIAQLLNASIKELPIYWEDSSKKSNIIIFRDAMPMVLSLFRQLARFKSCKLIKKTD